MNFRLSHCNDHRGFCLISGGLPDLQNHLSPQLAPAFPKGYMTATKGFHRVWLSWELLSLTVVHIAQVQGNSPLQEGA